MRYDILGPYVSGRRFAEAVRGHWGIEDRLHRQLDVTFREDECRVRKGHADADLAHVRRTALSLLQNETTARTGLKNKRLAAGWNDDYLAKVVFRTCVEVQSPWRNTGHGSGLGVFRWVTERTLSWLHQFRRLRLRYDRRADIHEAFLSLAESLICLRLLPEGFH